MKKLSNKNNKKIRMKESTTISRKRKLLEYTHNLTNQEYSFLRKFFSGTIQQSANKNYDEAIYYIDQILNKISEKLPEDLKTLLFNHRRYLEYLKDIQNKVFLHQEKINNKINELSRFFQNNQDQKSKIIVNYNNYNFDFSKLDKKEILEISRDLVSARHFFNSKYFDKTIEILEKIKEKYGEKFPINYFEALHNYLKIINAANNLENKGINFFGNSPEAVSLYNKFKHYYDITTNSLKKAINLVK